MKIMAICGSGLGSSFMVEMNIKKVLKKLDIEAEVEHSDLSSATPGAADLFVMAKDIAASASVPESQLVVITNIIDINELEAQLRVVRQTIIIDSEVDMFILETLNFVVDILKVPSVLVGLIALIGLVAQKKSFSDVVKGTIKTILGFIVLGGGATVLVGSLNPLGGMFEHALIFRALFLITRRLFLLPWKNTVLQPR